MLPVRLQTKDPSIPESLRLCASYTLTSRRCRGTPLPDTWWRQLMLLRSTPQPASACASLSHNSTLTCNRSGFCQTCFRRIMFNWINEWGFYTASLRGGLYWRKHGAFLLYIESNAVKYLAPRSWSQPLHSEKVIFKIVPPRNKINMIGVHWTVPDVRPSTTLGLLCAPLRSDHVRLCSVCFYPAPTSDPPLPSANNLTLGYSQKKHHGQPSSRETQVRPQQSLPPAWGTLIQVLSLACLLFESCYPTNALVCNTEIRIVLTWSRIPQEGL